MCTIMAMSPKHISFTMKDTTCLTLSLTADAQSFQQAPKKTPAKSSNQDIPLCHIHYLARLSHLFSPTLNQSFGSRKAGQSSSHMYTYVKRGKCTAQTDIVWIIFKPDNPWLSNQKWTICTNLPAIINADTDHTFIFCTSPSKLPQFMLYNSLTHFNILITFTVFS